MNYNFQTHNKEQLDITTALLVFFNVQTMNECKTYVKTQHYEKCTKNVGQYNVKCVESSHPEYG
jgi:hypothetical protein